MNDKVVPIKPPEPMMTGMVKCLSCRHEWCAVRPVGTVWHQCPACTLIMGRTARPVAERDDSAGMVWHCNCGNDLFYMEKDYAHCPVCGLSYDYRNF